MLNWNDEKIVLYHGSNVDIDNICINKTKKESDFGQGFYLTTSKKQAEEWAIRKGKYI